MQALAPGLRELRQLQQLNISGNHVCASGATALAPALGALLQLTHLNLRHDSCGPDGVAALAPHLSGATRGPAKLVLLTW